MSNPWISALKKWNSGKPRWTIPKKGTVDYLEVKKIASGPVNGRRKSRPVNGRRKTKKK